MKKYIITSKAGMPPFSSTTTRAAAEADSREARQLGLDGEIIEETSRKSYQQIAGDGTTDRAVGGDTAPASPAHTPEPWSINAYEQWDKFGPIKRAYIVAQWDNGFSETLLIATVNTTKQTEANAARICAAVNACAGMTDPEAEIKALRDALIEASNALLWIAQEAEQRAGVPKAIIGGARHHAVKAKAFGGEAGK